MRLKDMQLKIREYNKKCLQQLKRLPITAEAPDINTHSRVSLLLSFSLHNITVFKLKAQALSSSAQFELIIHFNFMNY